MTGYAVLDLETTGLSPTLHDRIVEVAVVCVDAQGAIESEWSTLVNPGRDLGPQHVHGITAADAMLAPAFADVAGWVARLLADRVVVGHNVAFDVRFLTAELARAGLPLEIDASTCLCTMHLSRAYIPGASRGLAVCCELAGVRHDGVHSALGDARATAGLMRHFLGLVQPDVPWSATLESAAHRSWLPPGDVPARPVSVHRGDSRATHHWLATLADRLPRVTTPPHADEYLALLDLALLDRALSVHERTSLLAAAHEIGLSRADIDRLHRGYLAAIAHAALADAALEGRGLSGVEAGELHGIAGALGLDGDDVTAALAPAGMSVRRPVFALAEGDQVVFTGELSRPRDEWRGIARDAGLVPWPHVTETTRLVIAADPDSLSGKARAARRYGIPVVNEPTFAGLLARA